MFAQNKWEIMLPILETKILFVILIPNISVHEHAVLSICTQGLAAIGVDELLLLLQFDSAYFPKVHLFSC